MKRRSETIVIRIPMVTTMTNQRLTLAGTTRFTTAITCHILPTTPKSSVSRNNITLMVMMVSRVELVITFSALCIFPQTSKIGGSSTLFAQVAKGITTALAI